MRRHLGISSISRQSDSLASYSTLSTSISTAQLALLDSQLSTFQAALQSFATKHRAKILSDPVFRQHFSVMCSTLGVDPLGGGKKGVWDYLGVGDWTYGLAVQVVDVCLGARERNGGLMEVTQVLQGVARLRTGNTTTGASSASTQTTGAITVADIARAIKALEPLGCGYAIVDLPASSAGAPKRQMVRSVAQALDTDALECAAANGRAYTTEIELASYARSGGKQWSSERASVALHKALMEDALVWVDEQATEGFRYWVPALVAF